MSLLKQFQKIKKFKRSKVVMVDEELVNEFIKNLKKDEIQMRNCKICGKDVPDSFRDNLCDGCWEVITRIDNFLRLKKGRKLIIKKLKEMKVKWKK
jgi:hypothetical protein